MLRKFIAGVSGFLYLVGSRNCEALRLNLGGVRRSLAALCAGLCLIAAGALPVSAQDATWLTTPGSGDFNTDANWNPANTPGSGDTAFFGGSNTTSLTFSAFTTIGGWTFNAGAADYDFFTNGVVLTFDGTGIVINGGSATITNNTVLEFDNSSTAGSATITNNSSLRFHDTSTAGSAAITNNFALTFFTTSTAGNAAITNNGNLTFGDSSTAGSAAITNNSTITFGNSSTADSATIINTHNLFFNDTSTAGSATITNEFFLNFSTTMNSMGSPFTRRTSRRRPAWCGR